MIIPSRKVADDWRDEEVPNSTCRHTVQYLVDDGAKRSGSNQLTPVCTHGHGLISLKVINPTDFDSLAAVLPESRSPTDRLRYSFGLFCCRSSKRLRIHYMYVGTMLTEWKRTDSGHENYSCTTVVRV